MPMDWSRAEQLESFAERVALPQTEITTKNLLRFLNELIKQEREDLLKNLLSLQHIQDICNINRYNPFGAMLAQKKIELFRNLQDLMPLYDLGSEYSPVKTAIFCGSIYALKQVLQQYALDDTDQPPISTLLSKAMRTAAYPVFAHVQFALRNNALATPVKHELFKESLSMRNFSISVTFLSDPEVIKHEQVIEYRSFDKLITDRKRKKYCEFSQAMTHALAAKFWPAAVFNDQARMHLSFRFQKSTYKGICKSVRAVNSKIIEYVGGLRKFLLTTSTVGSCPSIPGDCWGRILTYSNHLPITDDLNANKTTLDACAGMPSQFILDLVPLLFGETAESYYMSRALVIWSGLAKKYVATEDGAQIIVSSAPRP